MSYIFYCYANVRFYERRGRREHREFMRFSDYVFLLAISLF